MKAFCILDNVRRNKSMMNFTSLKISITPFRDENYFSPVCVELYTIVSKAVHYICCIEKKGGGGGVLGCYSVFDA